MSRNSGGHEKSGGAPIHGGDIFAAARRLKISPRDFLDFSASVNPLGAPVGLKKHIANIFDLIEHYPDPFAYEWRAKVGREFGLKPENIIAGNGSTALIYLLARVLGPQNPVIAAPAFAEYDLALRRTGVGPSYVRCLTGCDFDLTPEVADKIFQAAPDMIFLANPTSPAGRMIDPTLWQEILGRARAKKTHIVLDEAFIDFTSGHSAVSDLRKNPNLIVLRSMTKLYALPGLRLGYLAAAGRTAARLAEAIEPWSVNSLALAAGDYCLDQKEYRDRTRTIVARERAWLTLGLTRPELKVIPGAANYLLVKLKSARFSVERLAGRLLNKGILIRDCASFWGMPKGWFRIAVRTRTENKQLVEAIDQVLGRRK